WTGCSRRKAARGSRRPGYGHTSMRRRQRMSKTTHDRAPARLTYDEAKMIWRARDAYRVESVLVGLVLVVFLLEDLPFLVMGRWDKGLIMGAVQGGTLWGVGWLLRQARRWVRGWWQGGM